MTIIFKQRICSVDGCNRKTRNKGSYRGKIRYDHKCESHHRLGMVGGDLNTHIYYWKKILQDSSCENCGWDKASCDRHRLNPKLGYIRENVKILCPNCHRLATIGGLSF